jgi:hypothetical protein
MFDATGNRDEYGGLSEDASVRLRISRPLLRILVSRDAERTYAGWLTNLLGYHKDTRISASALPVTIDELLSTCRNYHGDAQEVVQIVSWLATRAAYLIMTPDNRPHFSSMADLRPGACVVGDKTPLVQMFEALTSDAANLDAATDKEAKAWREALLFAQQAIWRAAAAQSRSNGAPLSHELRQTAFDLQHVANEAMIRASAASTAYVEARFTKLAEINHVLVSRKCPTLADLRESALTPTGTPGVDAWSLLISNSLYAMQGKGQMTGLDAGKDYDFARNLWEKILSQARAFALTSPVPIAVLELLTTKRLSEELEVAVQGNDADLLKTPRTRTSVREPPRHWPVVVLYRNNLRSTLGEVLGGIVARGDGPMALAEAPAAGRGEATDTAGRAAIGAAGGAVGRAAEPLQPAADDV